MKPTLFVLAAGMGSRYGGLKQLDGLGPNGETIMDYSVFDAKRAGFGKVVFVIRKSFEEDFRTIVLKKYEGVIDTEVVFQDITHVPEGFTYNPERTKPWGTNHAVLMGKGVILEPFAVINADDFYGKDAFEVMAEFLRGVVGKQNEYCMVGYRVGNTLSESGSVSRGVCVVDEKGNLTNVVERTSIERKGDDIIYIDENGNEVAIGENTPVSMNMWGLTPAFLEVLEEGFKGFFEKEVPKNPLKAEYLIPTFIGELLEQNKMSVKVLKTDDTWYGMTYNEDVAAVKESFKNMLENGLYQKDLFSDL